MAQDNLAIVKRAYQGSIRQDRLDLVKRNTGRIKSANCSTHAIADNAMRSFNGCFAMKPKTGINSAIEKIMECLKRARFFLDVNNNSGRKTCIRTINFDSRHRLGSGAD